MTGCCRWSGKRSMCCWIVFPGDIPRCICPGTIILFWLNGNDMENDESIIERLAPKADRLARNAESLSREIKWFSAVVNARLDEYFRQKEPGYYHANGTKKDGDGANE